jgi:pimeloyl-ACP methyl ester carboxylesterase
MKETLILLHGALGSKDQFNSLKNELDKSFDVHAINFEGHGGKDSDNEFSIQLFTQNVRNYLKKNSINDAIIFGYSMGGYVALNFALLESEKVKKVFTLGTKFDWSLDAAEKEVRMLNPSKVEEKVPQFAEKLRQLHHPQDWKQVMTKTSDMMLNMAKGAKLFDTDFKKIIQPVVIGIGSLDNMVSYAESEYVNRLLPNSTLVQLEGVKHPLEQINTNVLAQFLMSQFNFE